MAGEILLQADLTLVDGRFERDVVVGFSATSGMISTVGRPGERQPSATVLRGKALIPGFVNAHSHAFQRALRGRTESGEKPGQETFWTWREAMYRLASAVEPEEVHAISAMAFLEMLLSGITTVGEFHYLHHQPDGAEYADPLELAKAVRTGADAVGLNLVLLMSGYERAGFARPPESAQKRFCTSSPQVLIERAEALRRDGAVGLAAHSLRAVTLDYAAALHRHAREQGLPFHMHVSEQPAENDDVVREHGMPPVTVLQRAGMLDERFTAVHAVHLAPGEVDLLAESGATVCACPTTERNLGDGIVPADMLLAARVKLALGTDSQAQIAPMEDARELEYHLRLARRERAVLLPPQEASADVLARVLFETATCNGARSLGVVAGDIAMGKRADLVALDLGDASIAGNDAATLLTAVVFGLERAAVSDVWVGGRPVVRGGRHRLQEEVIRRFAAVQRRLWSGYDSGTGNGGG